MTSMAFFFFFFYFKGLKDKNASYNNCEWQSKVNKGEWAELYALYKILADQNLYVGEEENRPVLPVLSVLRHTTEDLYCEYTIKREDDNIIIRTSTEEEVVIPRGEFEIASRSLWEEIKKGQSTFEIPVVDKFREKTFCPNIKSFAVDSPEGGKDKSDIYIAIHDYRTGQQPKFGFSIKSAFSNPATLGNASGLTTFEYEITPQLSQSEIEVINNICSQRTNKKTGETKNIADIKGRVQAIIENGSNLKFLSVRLGTQKRTKYTFKENLFLIDSRMEEIVGELLKYAYSTREMKVSKIVEKMTYDNPLSFPMATNEHHYEAKIKHLLYDITVGMVPGTPWNGVPQANGGYLIVKETGDITCYHIFEKKSFEDYLYSNMVLETPDAGRLKFGSIETRDGKQIFSLNLQFRFT